MVPDVVLYNMFVTYLVKYFVKYLVQADRSCRQWILSDVILHNRFVTLVVGPPCWPFSIGPGTKGIGACRFSRDQWDR